MPEQSEVAVSVRLNDAMRAKLDSLARQTGRTRSQIIRLLIQQATVTPEPDVRCGEGIPSGGGSRAV